MTPRIPRTKPLKPAETTDFSSVSSEGRAEFQGESVPFTEEPARPQLSPDDKFTKKEELQAKSLMRLYRIMALVVSPINSEVATQIMGNAEEAAIAWVELARHDTRVRSAIASLSSAGVWGDVLGVHIEMFAPAISIPIMGRLGIQHQPQSAPMPMQPVYAVDPTGTVTPSMSDPAAAALADTLEMEMMRGLQPNGGGGPGDTIAAPPPPEYNGSEPPVGSAEHMMLIRARGIDPGTYSFPIDPNPPQG